MTMHLQCVQHIRLYYTGVVGYPIRAMWPEFAMPFVALRFHHIMYDVVGTVR